MTDPHALPKLMVAPNGARRGKADHPALPVTVAETVATAIACQKAGADGIHLHVRDQNARHSLDVGLYREAIAAVKDAVPSMFLQVTSEAAGRYDADAQRAMIRELRPASVSVALREIFPAPSEKRIAQEFYAWAQDEGVGVHHITYTPDELAWFLDCVDEGVIPGTHHQLQLVLGSYAGTEPSRPSDLEPYLARLLARQDDLTFDWMVCAFGPAETTCLAYTVSRGGKARVGFENSLWNADGSVARDNAERVAEVRAALDEIQSLNPAVQTLSPCDR